MSNGIILTQVAGACEPSALRQVAASGADAQFFVTADGAPEGAIIECLDGEAHSVNIAALPATLNDAPISRFSARLQSDTGLVAEWASILMIVAFNVPPESVSEVERWYAEEHIPMLMRAPGWLRARRFETVSSVGARCYTSIALHDLRDLKVLDSNERAVARSTAWRAQLERTAWFRQAGRFVYRRVIKA